MHRRVTYSVATINYWIKITKSLSGVDGHKNELKKYTLIFCRMFNPYIYFLYWLFILLHDPNHPTIRPTCVLLCCQNLDFGEKRTCSNTSRNSANGCLEIDWSANDLRGIYKKLLTSQKLPYEVKHLSGVIQKHIKSY